MTRRENETSFTRTDVALAAGIFAVALAIRLAYLAQVWDLPFFEFPLIDARSYDEWGRQIAAGHWLGDRTFYQAPAYPYFLGIVYSLFGHDLLVLHVVQMVMGATSCVLVYGATHRLFGRPPALAAGLLLAGYAPAIFFDGLIQKTSLGLLLSASLLVVLAGLAQHPRRRSAVASGLLVGLLALTRENALIFALVIPVWLAAVPRQLSPPRRAVLCGAFGLGVALVLLPVGVRNLAVGGDFTATTSQMGPNFYIGNNPDASGLYAPLLPGRHTPDFEGSDARKLAERDMQRELTPGEVSAYWMGRSLAWIRDAPAAWLSLLARKALLTVNDFEVPDTEDLYVNAQFSGLLGALLAFLRFGVLFPIAAAGIVIVWREHDLPGRRASGLFLLLAAVFAAAVAVFYVWARYRFPLVPLLVPFAGLAVARGVRFVRGRDFEALAAPTVALVAAALVSNFEMLERERFQHIAWTNLGNIMIRHQRFDEAEEYLQRAAAIHEGGADLEFHLAVLRVNQDRYADAERHLRRMLETADDDYRGYRLLARVLRRLNRPEEARRHQQRSIELDPDRPWLGRPAAPPSDPGGPAP